MTGGGAPPTEEVTGGEVRREDGGESDTKKRGGGNKSETEESEDGGQSDTEENESEDGGQSDTEKSEGGGKSDSSERESGAKDVDEDDARVLAAMLSEAKELKARAPYPHLKMRSSHYKNEEVSGSPDTKRLIDEFREAAEKRIQDMPEEEKIQLFGKLSTPGQQVRRVHFKYVNAKLGWTQADYDEYVDDSSRLIPGKHKVKYLKEDERSSYELYYDSTLHRGDPKQKTIVPFTTDGMHAKMKGKDWGIYVMDEHGHVYAEGHKPGLFHHSSFPAGGDVAAAGELKVSAGKLEHITNKTGHYHAGPENLSQAIQEFERMGISPNDYKVSEVSLRPGETDADIHPGDGDLVARAWSERYQSRMARV